LNTRCAQKLKELIDCINFCDSENLNIPIKKMGDILDFLSEIRDSLGKRNLIGSFNHFKTFINNQDLYSKEEEARINEKIDETFRIIEEQELVRKQILNDPTEFGRNVLTTAHYTQSHVEYQLCI